MLFCSIFLRIDLSCIARFSGSSYILWNLFFYFSHSHTNIVRRPWALSPIRLRAVVFIFRFPEACHRIYFKWSRINLNTHAVFCFHWNVYFVRLGVWHCVCVAHMADTYDTHWHAVHTFGVICRRRINEWTIETESASAARIKLCRWKCLRSVCTVCVCVWLSMYARHIRSVSARARFIIFVVLCDVVVSLSPLEVVDDYFFLQQPCVRCSPSIFSLFRVTISYIFASRSNMNEHELESLCIFVNVKCYKWIGPNQFRRSH